MKMSLDQHQRERQQKYRERDDRLERVGSAIGNLFLNLAAIKKPPELRGNRNGYHERGRDDREDPDIRKRVQPVIDMLQEHGALPGRVGCLRRASREDLEAADISSEV